MTSDRRTRKKVELKRTPEADAALLHQMKYDCLRSKVIHIDYWLSLRAREQKLQMKEKADA